MKENWTKAGSTTSQRATYFKQENLTGYIDNMRFTGKDTGGKLWEIINTSGYKFPETGGAGTVLVYVIGTILTLGALTIGFVLWRRREEMYHSEHSERM